MSERYTTVRPLDGERAGQGIGLTDYGRLTRAEMIAHMRRHYTRQMEQAQYVLNAKDDEFIVETHIGLHARRNVEEVSE